MENAKKELVSRILEYRRKRRNNFTNPHRHVEGTQLNGSKAPVSIEKGRLFESYVVKKFDPDYFTLIEWRSDKSVDGIFPVMSIFPDLEFHYQSKSESIQIAIECKWREHFYKDGIELEDYKLENYCHFQRIMEIPTFIIIGIGNTPSNPERLYTLPLKDIENSFLNDFELEVFRKRNPSENFFLQCSKLILR